MHPSNLSYHSDTGAGALPPVRYQWLYTLAVKVRRGAARTPDPLAGKLLVQIAATVLCGRPCKPGLVALGRIHGRSPRSIERSISALVAAGCVEVKRRGKKLSNVLRLATWLWRRLTGRDGTRQMELPGLRRADDVLNGVMESCRRAWEASRRALAPVPV